MPQIKPPLNKWHVRYWTLARVWAACSKDPNTRVGAVAIGDNGRPLSLGYNGFPRGVTDSRDRLDDRKIKLGLIVHAEKNCIYNAGLCGVPLQGALMYIHGCPVCHECAKGIIQAGFKSVYATFPLKYIEESNDPSVLEWLESQELAKTLFDEAGVQYNWFPSVNIEATEILP